jgi:hypothetical protein
MVRSEVVSVCVICVYNARVFPIAAGHCSAKPATVRAYWQISRDQDIRQKVYAAAVNGVRATILSTVAITRLQRCDFSRARM